jgi:glycerol-3-phosphate dehydrogenase
MSALRKKALAEIGEGTFDVLVIGGGINGAVSAACLSGRGARVALIDKSDFASFTSQQSSNLAWGGIKYMETFEFLLVRKLCMCRNRLIDAYPSTVQEIRFLTVHEQGFRHALWKLVAGTLLYWLIGSFFTRPPRWLTPTKLAREEPILELAGSDGGFEYSDAYLHDNDARFVWNFVKSAIGFGCAAANYVEALGSERDADGIWVTRVRDLASGVERTVRSRVLVNAAGPFVDALNARDGEETAHQHVFSKGIHLIVPKLTKSRRVLTFFADDGRLFFVIPMGVRTCIGTTDTRVDGPYTEVTAEDRRFVLDNINKRLRLPKPLTEADVIAERCGVRPLVVRKAAKGQSKDWMQLSRKHALDVDRAARRVSIFGGKLTDCLNVGEEIAAIATSLGIELPRPDVRWYGEPIEDRRLEFFARARRMKLDERTSKSSSELLSPRLWRRYGMDAFAMLDEIDADPSKADLLIEGAEYVRCELEHAAKREMIVKLDDFLRRRSKISLVMRTDEIRSAPGLVEACHILFGDKAEARLAEHFGAPSEPPQLAASA